ncbi:hypothetical protein BG005_011440 [Podila minutissima]|nr:hypothetical protein BG005_011440 [Podila minutissima]
MDLASPIDPSPLVSMWQGRRRPAQHQHQQQPQPQPQQQQQQGRTSHILLFRASETEKHASRASSKRSPSASRPRSTPHSTKRHSSADQYQYLSSSPFTISESRASTAVSYMQDVDVSEDVEMPSSAASASSSSSSSSASCGKMDAKTSLMRIAQCGRHEDSWCALQSGQYTRHYAESRSGVTVDGRRARRM